MTILKFVQRFQKLYMQTAVYNNAAILTREIRWAERHRIRHPNWFRKIFDAWNPWGPGEALRQGFRMKPLATDEQAVSLTFSFSNRHQYSKRNGFHCSRLSTPYVGRRISSVPAFVWIFSMLNERFPVVKPHRQKSPQNTIVNQVTSALDKMQGTSKRLYRSNRSSNLMIHGWHSIFLQAVFWM